MAQVERNSRASSNPPSTDKSDATSQFERKSRRQKSQRKTSGQKGHPSYLVRRMKWGVLFVIAILLVALWPKTDAPNSTPAPETARSSQSSRALQSSRAGQRAQTSPLTRVSDETLRDRILTIWPQIENDLPGRDPSVVELIRTLRELGRRDGPATLSFLDQLGRGGKESAWIRARVAVAGGWALSDPEEASRALLKKDHVLPSDFSKFVMGDLGSHDPQHLAITQAALPIFERWATESPDHARQF